MAIKKDVDRNYIAEMECWIKQHEVREKGCRTYIESLREGIIEHQKLIKLEQQQCEIIKIRKKQAQKELSDYKKEHGFK